MLSFPAYLRKETFQDPYQLIALFDSKSVIAKEPSNVRWMNKWETIQCEKLISSQYGITVTYQGNGYDKDCIAKCLMGIAAAGLSCIPMTGPLVALGSQLVTDAILDPESFTTAQGLVAKIPNAVTAFVSTGQITQEFLAEMKTGKPGSRHVLALEGDNKQGRSIQVGPDASGRGDVSGQSDQKVDTLVDHDTFEIFNDEPEQSDRLDDSESKSDSNETGEGEGKGENQEAKDGGDEEQNNSDNRDKGALGRLMTQKAERSERRG